MFVFIHYKSRIMTTSNKIKIHFSYLLIFLCFSHLGLFAQNGVDSYPSQLVSPAQIAGLCVWEKSEDYNSDNTLKENSIFNFHPEILLQENTISCSDKNASISMFVVCVSNAKKNGFVIEEDGFENILVANDKITNKRTLEFEGREDETKILFYKDRWDRLKQSKKNEWKKLSEEEHIAEILIYERAISKKQQKIIESYLAIKYGIDMPTNFAYLNSDGKRIYQADDDSEFSFRTTALGRDDNTSLYQKQATNTNAEPSFCLSLSELAPYNRDNQGRIKDKSFVFCSDNNGDFDFPKEANDADGIIERKWKLNLDAMQEEEMLLHVYLKIPEHLQHLNPSDWILLSGTEDDKKEDLQAHTLQRDQSELFHGTIKLDRRKSSSYYIQLRHTSHEEFESRFELYPNPVHVHAAAILSLENTEESAITYRIYNALGQFVRSNTIQSQGDSIQEEIQFDHKGSYTVELVLDGKTISQKIIVID